MTKPTNGQEETGIKVLKPSEVPKLNTAETRGRPQLYPFDELKVGGAFKVPEGKLTSVRQLVNKRNNLPGESLPRFLLAEGEDGNYYVQRTT